MFFLNYFISKYIKWPIIGLFYAEYHKKLNKFTMKNKKKTFLHSNTLSSGFTNLTGNKVFKYLLINFPESKENFQSCLIFSEKKKPRYLIKQVSLYKYIRVLASLESKLIRTLVFSTKIKITHVTYTLCKDLRSTNNTEIIVWQHY